MNPKQAEKIRQQTIMQSFELVRLLSLFTLMDVHGWKKKRLTDFDDELTKQFFMYGEYYSMSDIIDVLKDDAGFEFQKLEEN